jgi:ABC-type uncharacterized transport system auxiliary subunit
MNSKLMCAAALAATLAACGGGGGGNDNAPTPPVTQVPDSAMASSQAMVSFVKTMAQDENTEPLSMSAVESPKSDTEEPAPGG